MHNLRYKKNILTLFSHGRLACGFMTVKSVGFFFQIFKTIKTCSRYVYFHIVHRTLLYLLLLHGAHIIVTVEVYEPDVE